MNETITLFTETAIDSCHHLEGYDGKCKNLHGHTWLVQAWIQGRDEQKDEVGILFDFGEIGEIKDKFDHKNIDEILDGFNGTAENITKVFLEILKDKRKELEFRVRVYETAVLKKTYCQRQTKGFDADYC